MLLTANSLCMASPSAAGPRPMPYAARKHVPLRMTKVCCRSVTQETKEVMKKENWWNKNSAPNMIAVRDTQELVDALASAGEKLVIVEFYAPWCGACKALYPKICKIMNERTEDVLFIKVSFEDNKEICRTMGVKVLPFFHFYRGAEGKVDQFSCTVSKIQKLKDAIDDYGSPFCNLTDFGGLPEFPDVKPATSPEERLTQLVWQ